MNETRTLIINGVTYDLSGDDSSWDGRIIETEEEGFFVVDKNLNIGFDSSSGYTKQEINRILGKDASSESGETNKAYAGERINLDSTYRYRQKSLFSLRTSLTNGRQGAAIYGDTLFQFYQGTEYVELYSLKTNAYVKVVSRSDAIASNNHAGTATFGSQRYTSTDLFPLLYVSDMGESSTQCKVYVYRVTTSSGATALEPSSVSSLKLEQTITLPAYPSSPYLPDAAVDPESNTLIVWGYSQQSRETADVSGVENAIQIKVCDLPRLADGNVKIDGYKCVHNIPFHWGVQDGCIRNGKLYLVYGLYPDHEAGIIAIDYASGVVLTHVPLDMGVRFEPEGFDIYDNAFIMTTYKGASGYAYKISFN